VSLVTLLPFIVLIGAMFLMTRSSKRKQQQAAQMRDHMQPGSGVRTIGGMYATVKEVHEETVLLEVDAGTHAIFAKNAIATVLDDEEYNRIVHGAGDALDLDTPVVPDDASSLTETDEPAGSRVDLGKSEAADEKPAEPAGKADEDDAPEAEEKAPAAEAAAKDAPKADATSGADDAEPKKTEGESEAK
jgi:preprotein translocase subunit YajC